MNYHRFVLKSLIAGFLLLISATARSDEPAKTEKPDADPIVGKTPGDVRADNALEAMLAAARSTREGVQSVSAKAGFRKWVRRPDEEEPQLVTAGKLQLYSSDGKYHLKVNHEKMLRRTVHVPQGVIWSNKPGEIDVFRNAAGDVVEVPAKMANWKADNVFIINDGRTITSTVFTPRINPGGVRSNSHGNFRDACLEIDVELVDPARLVGGVGQTEAVVKNLGKVAIQVTDLPDGGFRATYRMKNAPKVRAELDAFAKDGFNVSASRIFNEGEQLPASAEEAVWKKVNGRWIVARLSSERRYRGSKVLAYSKEVVIYYSHEVNQWVDPEAFTTRSTNADWQPHASADE